MVSRGRVKKHCIIYLAAVLVYYLWFQAFYNMVAYGSAYPYESARQAITAFAFNFIPIMLLCLLNTLTVFRLTTSIKLPGLKILADICLSLLAVVLVNMVFLGVQLWLMHRQGYVDWAGTIFSDVLILLVNEVAFYLLRYRQSSLREEHHRHQATRLQYDVLKMQINPHFLFNSLNLLYSLTTIDIEKSRHFILSLSQLYRNILDRRDMRLITVADELQYLQPYIDILTMRFAGCFKVETVGSDRQEAMTRYIIPCCLQLLLENITKHNTIRQEQLMTVILSIGTEGVTVSNPIRPKLNVSPEKSPGVGLRYIEEVYAYYDRQFMTRTTDGEFVAFIPYL